MSPAQRRDPAAALGSRLPKNPTVTPGSRVPGEVPAALRTKPIKATFDIPPWLYRQTRTWAAERDLPIVEVTKRLFAELLTDPKLAARIEAGKQDT